MWGLMADADRRRVFAALALGEGTVSGVAAASGVPVRKVMKALARLESAGVVSASGDHWELRTDVIEERARTEAGAKAGAGASPTYEQDGLGQREASVLRAFLRDGRLVSIPATRSKRLVVLDHLARVFDIGTRYPEREVNALLRVFHPDHAALRRSLVDEGYLTREAGIYWRTGGTVTL